MNVLGWWIIGVIVIPLIAMAVVAVLTVRRGDPIEWYEISLVGLGAALVMLVLGLLGMGIAMATGTIHDDVRAGHCYRVERVWQGKSYGNDFVEIVCPG